MVTCLVGLLVAAAPPASTRWTWTYEDVRTITLRSAPPGVTVTPKRGLGRMSLDLQLAPFEGEAPRKLTVALRNGPDELAGRTWDVESNYGEAALTEKKGRNSPRPDEDGELPEPPESLMLLRFLLGTLLTADPIVAAVRAGSPCDAATREKVATATAHLVDRLQNQRTGEVAVKGAAAECLGGGRYSVRFVLTFSALDNTFEEPWSGTVLVPAGAWRAELDLKGSTHLELNRGKPPIRADGRFSLKSQLRKRP